MLRQELLGEPVRVTEIDPGMVETEFSVVRFGGDRERAAAVYEGVQPLTADDVADCVAWAATRPSHVNIDQIVVKPRDQASATRSTAAPERHCDPRVTGYRSSSVSRPTVKPGRSGTCFTASSTPGMNDDRS